MFLYIINSTLSKKGDMDELCHNLIYYYRYGKRFPLITL